MYSQILHVIGSRTLLNVFLNFIHFIRLEVQERTAITHLFA